MALDLKAQGEGQHALRLVLAHFPEDRDKWRPFEVEPGKHPFEYYSALFIVSVRADRALRGDSARAPGYPDAPMPSFPLLASDPLYGRIVKYYYDVKTQERKKLAASKYREIPADLRSGVRAILLARSSGQGGKNSRIELGPTASADSFRFWSVEDVPDDLLKGKLPRLVELPDSLLQTPSLQPAILGPLAEAARRLFMRKLPHFRVPSPAKCGPLQLAARVLKLGEAKDAEWFRASGPIAPDFEQGLVFRRETVLNKIRDMVISNPVSILEGVSATGKSVLVRNLAYDIYCERDSRVFYYSCSLDGRFDPRSLADTVNTLEGTIILEDIHLAVQDTQALLRRIKREPTRHILLTARPSFRDQTYSKDEQLGQLPSLCLEPFEDVDGLIDHYASRHIDRLWPFEARMGLKRAVGRNLCFLAYALGGYVDARGRGQPLDWLQGGVIAHLENLERRARFHNTDFPEALVALSPLYQGEVLTAESYLRDKLHFGPRVLQRLVDMGEVTRQVTLTGEVLYGLLHSTHAEAYWRYGLIYRKRRQLPEYEDFIFGYAVSDTPNALDAVVSAPTHTRRSLLDRLEARGRLTAAIEKGASMRALTSWALGRPRGTRFSTSLLDVLAKKIDACAGTRYAAKCIAAVYRSSRRAGRHLWSSLDIGCHSHALAHAQDLPSVGESIREIWSADDAAGKQLWQSLDLDALANRLNETEAVYGALSCLQEVCLANQNAGRELCSLVDTQRMAAKLARFQGASVPLAFLLCPPLLPIATVQALWTCLARTVFVLRRDAPAPEAILSFLRFGVGLPRWVCSHFSPRRVAAELMEMSDFPSATLCIRALCQASRPFGRRLWRALGPQRVADRIAQIDVLPLAAHCVLDVYEADCQAGDGVWGHLAHQGFARKVRDAADSVEAVKCVADICRANRQAGRELWKELDPRSLAAGIANAEDLRSACDCIRDLHAASPSLGDELWSHLDIPHLAERLSTMEDIYQVWACVRLIQMGDESIARELCRLLVSRQRAARLTAERHLRRVSILIDLIRHANRRASYELCLQLDPGPLAATLDGTEYLDEVAACIGSVREANRQVAYDLCPRLDPIRLGERFATAENADHVAKCIAEAFRSNRDFARKLWAAADGRSLGSRLSRFEDFETSAAFIDTLRKASRPAARELCRLLDLPELASRIAETEAVPEALVAAICKSDSRAGLELSRLLRQLGYA